MQIAVGLLTCDRYDYTMRTIESLLLHNDIGSWKLFYADDCSTDDRIRPAVEGCGFCPVAMNEDRKGCTVASGAMIHAIHEVVGDDWFLLYLQNDFESIRPIPVNIIDHAIRSEGVGSCRLWHATEGKMEARTRSWRHVTIAEEAVIIGRRKRCGRFSWHPQITRFSPLREASAGATSEKQMVSRLGKPFDVLYFASPVCQHIGTTRTPGGRYGRRSRRRR